MIAPFHGNDFVSGGLTLMVVGWLVAQARNIPLKLIRHAKERFVTTMALDSADEAYQWVRVWLAAQLQNRRLRNARALVRYASSSSPHGRLIAPASVGGIQSYSQSRPTPEMSLVPGVGAYWVKFEGHWLLVGTSRQDMKVQDIVVGQKEQMELTAFGRGSHAVFIRLLKAAYELTNAEREKRITIYTANWHNWNVTDQRTPRPPESLVFDDGLYEDLEADVRRFLARREWYVRMGIPYRRGYKLDGPPGNGKSSLVAALAGRLGRDVYVLPLAKDLSDDRFTSLLRDVPAGDIVLIEDIDRDLSAKDTELSLSGLLNALDGVAAREGRILFMTANHPERLDPAITRRGRVDVSVTVHNASRVQAARMFERFFPRLADAGMSSCGFAGDGRTFAEEFVGDMPERVLSMSTLQEILLDAEDSFEAAREGLWRAWQERTQPAEAVVAAA